MRNVGLKLTGSVHLPLNFLFRRKARFLLIKIHFSYVINAVYLPLQTKNYLRGFCSQDDKYTHSRWQYLQLYLCGWRARDRCGRAEVWGSTDSSASVKSERIPDIHRTEEHLHGYLPLHPQHKRSHPWVWAPLTCHRREIIRFSPTPRCEKSHHMKAQVRNYIIVFFSTPITLGYHFILLI